MKVAVSIPDEVFEETESLAKRLNASRSEIYSRALAEFLGRHVRDVGAEKPDASRARAARRVFERTDW